MYLKYDLKYNNLSEHGLTTQKIKKRLVFPSVCEAPTYLLSALHPQHPWIQPTSEKKFQIVPKAKLGLVSGGNYVHSTYIAFTTIYM